MFYPSKYLVLDLDETLIHSFTSSEQKWIMTRDISSLSRAVGYGNLSKIVFDYTGTYNEDVCYFAPRPGLRDFLDGISEIFTGVIVWSAGKELYVDRIVNKIFDELNYPVKVFDHSYLTFTDDGDFLKDLRKVYEHVPGANEKNTIIIDDKKSNFNLNPLNGLCIKEFSPEREDVFDKLGDHYLINILSYFKSPEFLRCRDVRELDLDEISRFCHIIPEHKSTKEKIESYTDTNFSPKLKIGSCRTEETAHMHNPVKTGWKEKKKNRPAKRKVQTEELLPSNTKISYRHFENTSSVQVKEVLLVC